MFKKVHIYPSDTLDPEKKQSQCSMCKSDVEKSIAVDVYESGCIICKDCQNYNTIINGNEGGDYTTAKEFKSDNESKQTEETPSDIIIPDLASGDHYEFVSQELDIKNDEEENEYQDEKFKNNNEAIIAYKNPNYEDNKSSVTDYLDSSKSSECTEVEQFSCNSISRPVVCPVSMCSKMVTIDSFMLHFHFDHSKVPRTTLDDTTPQEVLLKSVNFSTEIQCVATFIMEPQKRANKTNKKGMESITSKRSTMKDTKLLLLMAVMLPANPIKLPNVKCETSRIFTHRSVYTQTEKIDENDLQNSTECLSRTSSDYKSCISKSVHDEDEVLLIWLCKLNDTEKVFSITLLGEDKRRGYCYIGDAVHVREKQEPSLLYDRSECLIVKGSTINDFYDRNGQITAIVSIIG